MNFEKDIQECIQTFSRNGIVLYPTDTIWGIGCDATDEAAVAKIYALKKRSEQKSMIILLADENDIQHYCRKPSEAVTEKIAQTEVPLTIIYPEAKKLAANLINEDGTIAIRVTKDPFCKALIHATGKPLVSTSANISGMPSPVNFTEISEEIKSSVDYTVQHRQHDLSCAAPSRIIKWTGGDSFIIIRN